MEGFVDFDQILICWLGQKLSTHVQVYFLFLITLGGLARIFAHVISWPVPAPDVAMRWEGELGRFPFNKKNRFKISEFLLVKWNGSLNL